MWTILKLARMISAPRFARGEVAAKNEANRLWWNVLEKVRTHYQQNPDAD